MIKLSQLEKGKRIYYSKEKEFSYFYRACGYRWEESADPIKEDEKSFLNIEDAHTYLKGLKISIGFYPIIEKVEIDLEDFYDVDVIDLDTIYYNTTSHLETDVIYCGSIELGKDISGSIIIEWSYEKYIGYARNLLNIGIAGEYPFESISFERDLITGGETYINKPCISVLLSKEQMNTSFNLEDDIYEALSDNNYWRWNYFKNNPESKNIKTKIKEICSAEESKILP